MTSEQRIAVNTAIHTASVAAATVGGGLAQVPGSDSVPIIAIQTTMVIAIGRAFGKNLDESAAKAAVGTGLATLVGRGLSQFLVGWIPGIGNMLNATTAAGVTEALGWAIAADFEKGLL